MILIGKPNLSDLTDDGDQTDINERFALRLKIEPDDTSVNDFDSYGTIYEGHTRTNSYGYEERPPGFNGAARKVGRHCDLWWQPWDGATEQEIKTFLPTLEDLLEYGFKSVVLYLIEKIEDFAGETHEVEVDIASLGGVDSFGSDNSYLTEIVGELWWEIFEQAAKR